ncbi:hypothetical protein [Nocardia australiensis]|uniref:hypothetical protein n=1 Tax=Nocardia australiensis TaxID=2887191 RepID=UPI001D157D24|nr:hypothetical protein [Nocardia australiensis]
MTEFLLSPQRRDELATLLGDDTRLRTEYPAVADYLDTAARLPGTGDDAADRAFDIRLLHYLTGGPSENPYWDIVAPAVAAGARQSVRRVVNGGRENGSARLAYAQTVLQAAYAYAIPAPETLRWIAEMCDGRRILEIGAGRGYWAGQLARTGVEVLAFDSEPPGIAQNLSFPAAAGQPASWYRVGELGGLSRLRAAGGEGEAVLLLCWPPGWGNTMASEALASYRRAGGDRVIYIGEPRGGKTGDDAFFDALDAEWQLMGQDSNFVAWWNLDDTAQCWGPRS